MGNLIQKIKTKITATYNCCCSFRFNKLPSLSLSPIFLNNYYKRNNKSINTDFCYIRQIETVEENVKNKMESLFEDYSNKSNEYLKNNISPKINNEIIEIMKELKKREKSNTKKGRRIT